MCLSYVRDECAGGRVETYTLFQRYGNSNFVFESSGTSFKLFAQIYKSYLFVLLVGLLEISLRKINRIL